MTKITAKLWLLALALIHAGTVSAAIIVSAVPCSYSVGASGSGYVLDYSGHWPWLAGFITVTGLGLLCVVAVLVYEYRRKARDGGAPEE